MKHPTEKDRVKKVVAEHLGRRCFCKRWETCPVCKLEKLVLKEIKRAERRGREAERGRCVLISKYAYQNADFKNHPIWIVIGNRIADAIRNRRKV